MVSISEDWNINYLTKQIYHDQWKDEINGSSSSVAEVTTITCADASNFQTADSASHFHLYSAKDDTRYYVWFNITDAGTEVDPAVTGATGIQIDVLAADLAADVAGKLRGTSGLGAATYELDFTITGATNQCIITNTNAGSTTDTYDDTVELTTFTFATSPDGVGETIFSVNALYSYLQDTFDELGQMDDTVPMSAQTPTEYTLTNEWFIDEESIQYLNGGAIQTGSWTRNDTGDAGADIIGIIQVPYNTSPSVAPDANDFGETATLATDGDTGTILFADTTRRKLWVRPDTTAESDSFDDVSGALAITATSGMSVVMSAAASTTGENIWANMYTIGTIEANTALYVIQDSTKLTAWWPTGHMDVLIRVQEFDSATGGNGGSLGTIMIGARQYSKLFDHFVSTGITGGRNPVPLATGADLNNTTGTYTATTGSVIAFVAGNRFIKQGDTTIEGTVTSYAAGVLTYYLSGTSLSTFTTADTIHVVGASTTTDTLTSPTTTGMVPTYNSNITFSWDTANTMSFDLNNGNGTQPYDISIDLGDTTTVAKMYEYLKYITGRGYTTSPTQLYSDADNNAEIIPSETIDGEQYISVRPDNHTPVKASPFGTFAGGKFFGAQGVWLTNVPAADAQNYQLVDSDGDPQTPPNTVAVTVSSVVSSDVVGVFVYDTATGIVDKDTYTMGGQAAGVGTVGVAPVINSETPQAGILRIIDNDTTAKTEYQYEYASWSGTVFTLNTLYTSGSPGNLSSGSGLTLYDADGTSFWSARIRAGDKVYDKTDTTGYAFVSTISTDNLTTTAFTEATSAAVWSEGVEYYIETLTDVYHTSSDNVYVPIINEIIRGSDTSVNNTLIKAAGIPIPVIIRVRQGKTILPFEITNSVTFTAGMTQAAIRTTDSIAT